MTTPFEKIVHIKVDRDTLQIFYEMPRKALLVMAGLDRKVLNSRRITKLVAPSNPVFIGVSSHPLVWLFIIRSGTLYQRHPAPIFFT